MKEFLLLITLAFGLNLFSQNVAINSSGNPADNSAMLDVSANDKGVLIPRLTEAQRIAITTPAEGLLVYQSDGESGFYYYDGSAWVTFLDDNKGWKLEGNAGTNPANDFLGTSDANDFVLRSNGVNRLWLQSGGPAVFNNNLAIGSTVLNTWAIGTDNAFAAEAVDGAAMWAFTGSGDGLFVDRSADDAAAFAAVWAQSAGQNTGVFLNSQLSTSATAVDAQIIGTGTFDAAAVRGISEPSTGWGIGARFIGGWRGVWATTPPGTPFGGAAVYAEGDLVATGTKPFEIDHPLDPENKVLRHFAIESDEVLNHYRGLEVLDQNGEAIVEMPEYFAPINHKFTYQLTAVGAAMPDLHISKELEGNSFTISGGISGKKVSWVIQAERNDKYLQTYPERRRVELDKKEIYRGEYYDEDSYGKSQSERYSKHMSNRRKGRESSNFESNSRRMLSQEESKKP